MNLQFIQRFRFRVRWMSCFALIAQITQGQPPELGQGWVLAQVGRKNRDDTPPIPPDLKKKVKESRSYPLADKLDERRQDSWTQSRAHGTGKCLRQDDGN